MYRSVLPIVMLTAVALDVTSCGKAGQPAINSSPGAVSGAPRRGPRDRTGPPRRLDGCAGDPVIAAIVAAVRDGDDGHIRDLLRAQYADVDTLFSLRDALTLDLEGARLPGARRCWW